MESFHLCLFLNVGRVFPSLFYCLATIHQQRFFERNKNLLNAFSLNKQFFSYFIVLKIHSTNSFEHDYVLKCLTPNASDFKQRKLTRTRI